MIPLKPDIRAWTIDELVSHASDGNLSIPDIPELIDFAKNNPRQLPVAMNTYYV